MGLDRTHSLGNRLDRNVLEKEVHDTDARVCNCNAILTIPKLEDPQTDIELGASYTSSEATMSELSNSKVILSVRNGFKSYSKGQSVLNNFCMTVEAGTIYSLLGASGCGKSTLLSCCVGLQRLDSGELEVFGKRPGSKNSKVPGANVGYMPQELALYKEFTIGESLFYYGRVYGMSREEIHEKIGFILDLLELPGPSRRVSQLSGGQQRRVSFALATFHEPPLLILDEPTVGVDPMLRESIWSYLCKLVLRQKTTVLITTHYISEAQQAHKIGVMRNGKLIAEKSPETLFQEFPMYPLLDQIILQLYKQDSQQNENNLRIPTANFIGQAKAISSSFASQVSYSSSQPSESSILRNMPPKNPALISFKPLYNDATSCSTVSKDDDCDKNCDCLSWTDEFFGMRCRLDALLHKNTVVLLRNIWFLLFVFLVPAMQIVLICLAIGPPPKNLSIGVVNYELIQKFNESFINGTSYCQPVPNCEWPYLFSCRFINYLPKETFKLASYASGEEALIDIKRGTIWGYVGFPTNYSAHVVEKATSGIFADNETFDGSRITFEMDMSNQEVGQTMKKIFFEVYQKYMRDTAEDCGQNPRAIELPLDFKKPVYGTAETSFREFLAPSVLLGLLFFFPLCSSGISYITEKKTGTLDRSLVAGVTNAEIMISFLITQTVVLFGQSAFAFLILTVVFRIEVEGSLALAIFLAILIGIGGMSMGFLISTVCREEVQAVLLAIGSFFPNFILAGVVWPTQAMPVFLQGISYLLPCTLACESMRSIVSRGWGISHPAVWTGFVSTSAWIFIYWTLTIIIHKFKPRGL